MKFTHCAAIAPKPAPYEGGLAARAEEDKRGSPARVLYPATLIREHCKITFAFLSGIGIISLDWRFTDPSHSFSSPRILKRHNVTPTRANGLTQPA